MLHAPLGLGMERGTAPGSPSVMERALGIVSDASGAGEGTEEGWAACSKVREVDRTQSKCPLVPPGGAVMKMRPSDLESKSVHLTGFCEGSGSRCKKRPGHRPWGSEGSTRPKLGGEECRPTLTE